MVKIFFISILILISCNAYSTKVFDGEHCPDGWTPVKFDKTVQRIDKICKRLGAWWIVRLAEGGSVDGPGYDCKVRTHDNRNLGHVLCERNPKIPSFVNVSGKTCPKGTQLASAVEAYRHRDTIKKILGPWDISRLKDGGSMDGYGYDSKIRTHDSRDLGHILCVSYTRP